MRHLCFEISSGSIQYALFDSESQSILKSGFLALNDRVSELKKESCSNFLRSENLLNFDGEVSLAYSGHRVTLVPQVIFGESSAKDVFELCFGKSEEIVEHNRFFEQTLVVVYEIEEWIKRFFVIRYPRIIIQHETTHVFRGIFNKPSFEPKIHLVIARTFFGLILTAKSKIIFFNTFEYTSIEDIFYYTTHAWKNNVSKDKKIDVFWHTNDESLEQFSELSKIFERQFQSSQYRLEKITKSKHQLLCV